MLLLKATESLGFLVTAACLRLSRKVRNSIFIHQVLVYSLKLFICRVRILPKNPARKR